jgi:demethylmenaquinone methyltransferase/2-methoxy-6-polyprenyl-1,4-benzoquinol methylase
MVDQPPAFARDQATAAYYEQRASEYDEWYLGEGHFASRERPGWHKEVDEVVRLVEGLPLGRTLDVACGSGFLTRHLQGFVVGLDQSRAMVSLTQSRLSNGVAIVGDALSLPFADGAFTRVLTAHFYGHLPDNERAAFVSEARRVASEIVVVDSALRPGIAGEQWQTRVLNDGSEHRVFKRYLSAPLLADEEAPAQRRRSTNVLRLPRPESGRRIRVSPRWQLVPRVQQALVQLQRIATCMRQHGVTDFPDPERAPKGGLSAAPTPNPLRAATRANERLTRRRGHQNSRSTLPVSAGGGGVRQTRNEARHAERAGRASAASCHQHGAEECRGEQRRSTPTGQPLWIYAVSHLVSFGSADPLHKEGGYANVPLHQTQHTPPAVRRSITNLTVRSATI